MKQWTKKKFSWWNVNEEGIILEIVRPGTSRSLPPGEIWKGSLQKLTQITHDRVRTGDLSKSDKDKCRKDILEYKDGWEELNNQLNLKEYSSPTQINKVLDSFKIFQKSNLLSIQSFW